MRPLKYDRIVLIPFQELAVSVIRGKFIEGCIISCFICCRTVGRSETSNETLPRWSVTVKEDGTSGRTLSEILPRESTWITLTPESV